MLSSALLLLSTRAVYAGIVGDIHDDDTLLVNSLTTVVSTATVVDGISGGDIVVGGDGLGVGTGLPYGAGGVSQNAFILGILLACASLTVIVFELLAWILSWHWLAEYCDQSNGPNQMTLHHHHHHSRTHRKISSIEEAF